MKVKFDNQLVYFEYKPIVNDLKEIIEDIIPDKINDIEISASLDFCGGYCIAKSASTPNPLPNLNIVLHLYLAGYVNELPVSQNLHRRLVFSPINVDIKKINKIIRIQVIQLLLLIIKFSKTGELTLLEEIGENNDFF